MKEIDLRSDTVTLPTEAMLAAMSSAKLGDDVFGEDPTVNRLEEMGAQRIGTEAALFVPSGTMANLVSCLTHCGRADEVILGDQAHMFYYEAGGMAAMGGVHPHTVANQEDGTMLPGDIAGAIRGDNVHFPRTRLICLENTHNRCGGSPLTAEYMDTVTKMAKEHGISVHVDGARIFNAAVALGVDVKELTRGADSVSFCLSKGLAGPVGSVVCGSKEFIAEARRNRKILGGGMRQAGVIAAAGIVALEEMVERLADDHTNASRLAEGIANTPGLSVEAGKVKTNIVYFDLTDNSLKADDFVARLAAKGVRLFATGPRRMRVVTHYGVDGSDIEAALVAISQVMGEV
jgi:threonine aldolase